MYGYDLDGDGNHSPEQEGEQSDNQDQATNNMDRTRSLGKHKRSVQVPEVAPGKEPASFGEEREGEGEGRTLNATMRRKRQRT